MSITSLPEEIIIKIIKKLDTKSVIALYQTCSYFANIVVMRNVVKECHFSLNTLANAKSLTSNFFCNIANHLRVLNLCAVQDLTRSLLLPAMKKLKNLYSLDVTFTSIILQDLLLIHKFCPTMKSIAINLAFTISDLTPDAVIEYQNMFQHFECVHYVYDSNTWNSRVIFILLYKANLKSLTGTYTHVDFTNYMPNGIWMPPLQDYVTISKDNCESLNLSSCNAVKVIRNHISFKNTEYLIFSYRATTHEFKCRVICTPLLQPFFRDNFGINPSNNVDEIASDNTHAIYVVMFWSQDTTIFDDIFFLSLFKKLQPSVPLNFMPVTRHSPYRNLTKNWVFLKSHMINDNQQKSVDVPLFKKRRIAPQSVVLDFDELCTAMTDIVLMVSFATLRKPVTLSSGSAYLKELTHLYLMHGVKHDSDFFNILFRTCNKLETIDVDLCKSNSSTSFSKSVPLSKSLKNLRLAYDSINFATLFSCLSQCRSLENIHIDDTAVNYHNTDLANPRVIFVNCTNLYKFTINVHWYETVIKKNLKMMKNVKADLGLHHLHVNMNWQSKLYLDRHRYFDFDNKNYKILSHLFK